MGYDGEVRIKTTMDNSKMSSGITDTKKKVAALGNEFDGVTKKIASQEQLIEKLSRQMDKAAEKAEKLKVAGNTKGYEKAVKDAEKLAFSFFKAENALGRMKMHADHLQQSIKTAETAGVFGFIEQANKARENIRVFEQEIERLKELLSNEQDPAMIKALQYEISATEEAFSKFKQNISQPIANIMQLQELQERLEATKNKISELEYQFRLAKADRDILGMAQLTLQIAGAKNEVGYLNMELSKIKNADIGLDAKGLEESKRQVLSIKTAFRGIGHVAKMSGRIALGAIQTLGSGIAKVTRGVGKFAKGLLVAAKNAITLGNSSRRASGGIQNLGKRMLQLAAGVFVFNVLRRGMRALSRELSNLLMQNEEFAAAWNAIKVNLLTAFAPIWEVIQPALITFMNILAQVTAVLAKFVALLFGKTITESRASAKALNNQAKGIGAVGGAAKQANKDAEGFLGTFDSINKAASDNAGGGDGGGGGGAGGGGLDFNVAEPPDIGWLDELAEKLKTIFNIADPEYWQGLGSFLAENIASTLMSIPWARIQNAAHIFAINLTSFLNGFLVNENLWKALGNTIAEAFNTILTFLHTVGDWFDFSGLGEVIGKGVNTLFEKFDFNLLGATFGTWLKGIYDTITSFVSTFDWGNVLRGAVDAILGFLDSIDWADAGRRLSDSVKNVLSSISKAVIETDWVALGKKLWDAVWGFLSNVDWGGMMSELAYLIGTLLISAFQLLWGFIKDAVAAIGNWFMEFFEGWTDMSWGERFAAIGRFIIDGIFLGIWNVIKGIGLWIWNNIFVPFWEGIKAAFGIASPSTKMVEIGMWLIEGLLNGLKALGGLIADFFVGLWEGVKEVFSVVGSWFSGIFSGAWDGIKNAWGSVVNWFSDLWDSIVNIFIVVATWYYDKFAEAWEGIKNIWSAVVGWFNGIWDGIVAIFMVVNTWFADKFRAAWQGITSVWSAATSWFSGLWDGIKNVFNAVNTWFRDKFQAAWDAIKAIFTPVGDFFKGVWDTITGIFSSIGQTVADAFSGAVKGAVNAILNFAENTINTFIRAINTAIGIINAIPGVNISTISLLSIPRLAKGGIVDGATIAEIGEKGREAVLPLDNNTGWMADLAKELKELMGEGQQRSQKVEIILEIDRREFGRAVVDIGDSERQRRGVRIQARAVTTR